MSYYDPTLRVRLEQAASEKICREYYGDKAHFHSVINMTRVHIEQGLVYAEVTWGIDGNDMPISPDVADFVDSFVVTHKISPRADGIYNLRDESNNILARARVTTVPRGDGSEVFVSGKERKDVIKLFEQLRDGKIRPDVEHEEFEQIEGNLNELRRLRRQVPTLKGEIETRDEIITSYKEQLKKVRVELAEAQAAATTN